MYCVAIVSGLVANELVINLPMRAWSEGSIVHVGGDCVPFDLAVICLAAAAVLAGVLWEENYGSASEEGSSNALTQVLEATAMLWRTPKVGLLCVIVSCFEGAMYAFIFNWTPALQSRTSPPPYGLIFSLFMMSCTCGASVHTVMADLMKPSLRLMAVFVLGGASLAIAAWR